MSGLLAWHDGTASHRGALQHFHCTSATPKRHDRRWREHTPFWWEYEVQQQIRQLKPPLGFGRPLRLGFDPTGLVAVSCWQELAGPEVVELEYAGIDTRLRHKGGGFADEMMADTLDVITARAIAKDVPEVRITGYVWEDNRASQSMCRRIGMRHTDMAGPGVQVWSMRLPITGA